MSVTDVAERPAAAMPRSGAVRLPVGAVKLEEQCRRRWFVRAPEGTSKEDPQYPIFWATEARFFTRHDIVTLLACDESWEMELCVEAVRSDGVEMSVRKNYSRKGITPTMTEVAPGFHTEFRANERWCVVRRKDQVAVVKGHALESGAVTQWRREQPRPII